MSDLPTPAEDFGLAAAKGTKGASVQRAKMALRLVCASLPHLAGLAHCVRVKATRYFPVAAIGPSGLLAINPDVFAQLPLGEAAFIMAHELLHLALDTHGRRGSANRHLVNVAHDYVINDMLREELRRLPPLGGLVRVGASEEGLEKIVTELSQSGQGSKIGCWSGGGRGRRRTKLPPRRSPMRQALEEAGLLPPDTPPPPEPKELHGKVLGDLLDLPQETSLEPELTPEERQRLTERVRREAVKAASLGALRKQMNAADEAGTLIEPERGESLIKAVQTAYHPPWQLALQHWMDAVAPSARSYARPSRRGADRADIVLCGRKREGWTLHIVLDTSGSMASDLPKILGTIASFCDGSGVSQVHILQCDIEVTSDEWIEPPQLAEYRIAGFGGSDMSPAMLKLADDTEVSAVLVLTDGYIEFPAQEPPYTVLWGLVNGSDYFAPPYGVVVRIDL
ncbi:MAG: DUF2201 family putative metallopeptidase [Gemmataceae bacterium]